MLRIVMTVFLILLLMAYGAGFILWNMSPVEVVGFQWADTAYRTEMPLAFLAGAGVVVGVLFMAFAAWSTWAGQRVAALETRARLDLAKKKLSERTDMVRALREDVASLRAALSATAASSTAGDTTEPREPARGAASAEDAPAEDGVEDDDLII